MDRELKLKLAFTSNIYINNNDEKVIDNVIEGLKQSHLTSLFPLISANVTLSDDEELKIILKKDKIQILAIGNLKRKILNIAALYINGYIDNNFLFKFDGNTYIISFDKYDGIGIAWIALCPSKGYEVSGLIKRDNLPQK